jgi:hypothetical protein
LRAAAAEFLEPAPAVPVTTEIGGGLGDDDEMSDADRDRADAPGTAVLLARLVPLHDLDDLGIEQAHRAALAGLIETHLNPATMSPLIGVFSCAVVRAGPMAGHRRR